MKMQYEVKFDLSDLLGNINSQITAAVLPTVSQAVRALLAETEYRWKDKIAKAHLWNGEKQPYIESIRSLMVGDFSGVVFTDYKLAEPIETGRPQHDLKAMLDSSMKVRIAQNGKNAGKRYLIIPFRHNTPGNVALAQAMPPDVYKQARMLDVSRVTGGGSRPSGTGAMSVKSKKPIMVPQHQYKWGDRLPPGLRPKLKDYHTTDQYAGMVRFKTSAGGANSSQYMTFRVMMEGSPKWIVPAKPGLYIAKAVQTEINLLAPKVFEQAVKHLK